MNFFSQYDSSLWKQLMYISPEKNVHNQRMAYKCKTRTTPVLEAYMMYIEESSSSIYITANPYEIMICNIYIRCPSATRFQHAITRSYEHEYGTNLRLFFYLYNSVTYLSNILYFFAGKVKFYLCLLGSSYIVFHYFWQYFTCLLKFVIFLTIWF